MKRKKARKTMMMFGRQEKQMGLSKGGFERGDRILMSVGEKWGLMNDNHGVQFLCL